jgi:hypothetical protein
MKLINVTGLFVLLALVAGSSIVVGGGGASAAGSNEIVIAHFKGGNGARPFSGLVANANGNLFGATYWGGGFSGLCSTDGCGAVFELTKMPLGGWKESVIYAFHSDHDFDGNGVHPWGGVIVDGAGDVFGTTQYGGSTDQGVVYELVPPAYRNNPWTEHVLYNFQGGKSDGSQPLGGLVQDGLGNLFGTTQHGGFGNGCCGTAFELSPPSIQGKPWTESILFRFGGRYGHSDKGAFPRTGLILDPAGNLYGTTPGDRTNSFGTVFELSPPSAPGGVWTQTDLHNFTGKPLGRGFAPYGGVIRDSAGNLYGTTVFGGNLGSTCALGHGYPAGCGTVFQLKPPSVQGGTWTEVVLYRFAGGTDGLSPEAGLVADSVGDLFGTTGGPDFFPNGTVFELRPPSVPGGAWTETILHAFGVGNDGYNPSTGPLTFDASGALVGTTSAGGGTCNNPPPTCGVVYEITPGR